MRCPHCNHELDDQAIRRHTARENGRRGGLAKSKAKQAAAQANGKKGGRPRKETS